MSTYYRESFEYPPICIFLDSSIANNIMKNDNKNFNLNQKIQWPNNAIGYISLQELTIANTNYNINKEKIRKPKKILEFELLSSIVVTTELI